MGDIQGSGSDQGREQFGTFFQRASRQTLQPHNSLALSSLSDNGNIPTQGVCGERTAVSLLPGASAALPATKCC